ncbi:conserved Plasmodium protein, unknown function [Plasmodium relictum]|uniref:Uncharacterized protein n=1 Tax=Plasmodium relictum TaxID=85471 RepID=A0A1J1H1M5_PLARL|nr:conserved Plasmodium protein, unknown function [Plasmodium relictum]CRG98818.1 conserved Plasmodium protein, unknown function [Plasmodium relictum]
MNNDFPCDYLTYNFSSKISEAINKYSINTLNYNSNKKLEIIKQNESNSDETIQIYDSSDMEMELKTHNNINPSIYKKDYNDKSSKYYYTEKLKENDSKFSTILNFIIEQYKVNANDLNKNILQNIKITEEINKTKDINDLMRKIEHEEIKELISLNLKLFLTEIKKIYDILNYFSCKEYNENKKLVDIIKTGKNHSNDDRKNKINRKQFKKINLLTKKYIILKKYYKKLCKKYKEENNILKKIYFNNKNMIYLSKNHCKKKYNSNSSETNCMHANLKKNNKEKILSNSVLYKDYLNNIIYKKYIINKKEDNKIIQDIIKKNKRLQIHLKKYNCGYSFMFNKKSLRKWCNNIKKLNYSNNKNLYISKNNLNYYHNFLTPINIKKKKNEADEKFRAFFDYEKSEVEHNEGNGTHISFKDKDLFKKNEISINVRETGVDINNNSKLLELNKTYLNNIHAVQNEKVKYSEEEVERENILTKRKLGNDNMLNKDEKKTIENYGKNINIDDSIPEKKQEEKKNSNKNKKNKSENAEICMNNDQIIEDKEKKNIENQLHYDSMKKRNKDKINDKKKKKNACKFEHALKNKNIIENGTEIHCEKKMNKNGNNYNKNNNGNNIKIECNKNGNIDKKGNKNRINEKERTDLHKEKEKTLLYEKGENSSLNEKKEKSILSKENQKIHLYKENEELDLYDQKKGIHFHEDEKKEKIVSNIEKEKMDFNENKGRIILNEEKQSVFFGECENAKKIENDAHENKKG